MDRKNLKQPLPLIKIKCPTCGELMVKFYPLSSYFLPEGAPFLECRKCLSKRTLKAGVAQ